MTNLPRVLFIDDELGSNDDLRRLFCKTLALRQANESSQPVAGCLAVATFCSGQLIDQTGWTRNDASSALKAILAGWPFESGGRWALVCLDLNFTIGEGANQENLTFGLDLLKMIRGHSGLSGIPVVLLSTWRPDMVEAKALEEGVFDLPPIIQKWGAFDQEETDAAKRHEFSRLLFHEGLIEDGALRTAGPAGHVSHTSRTDPILGSSIRLLETLRRCRKGAASATPFNVLVEREHGDDGDRVGAYINDHKKMAMRSGFITAAWVDKLQNCDLDGTPGKWGQTGTLTWSGLDDAEDAELTSLIEFLRKEEPSRQFVLSTFRSNLTNNKSLRRRQVESALSKIRWPPLRERNEDIEYLFRAALQKAQKAIGSKAVISQEVLKLVHRYDWPGNNADIERAASRLAADTLNIPTILEGNLENSIAAVCTERDMGGVSDFEDLLLVMQNFKFQRREIYKAWPRLLYAFRDLATALFKEAELATRKSKSDTTNCSAFAETIGLLPRDRGDRQRTSDAQRALDGWKKRLGIDDPIVNQLISGRKAKQLSNSFQRLSPGDHSDL